MDGTEIADFTIASVANNSPDGARPALSSASMPADGAGIILDFNKNLST